MTDGVDRHDPASWHAEIIAEFRLRGDERCAAASPIPGFPQILDSVLPALPTASAGRWIDIGGGLGGSASWIERRLSRPVTLVDSSVSNVRAAGRLFPELAAVASPVDALPVRSDSISVAWLNHVASRSSVPDAVLAEVTRVLQPSGHVAVTDLWAPAGSTLDLHRVPLRSIEDFTERAELFGLRLVHVAVAEPNVGWWSEAEVQVINEIHGRHHSHPAYPSWRRKREWIETALRSDEVLAAGLVMSAR